MCMCCICYSLQSTPNQSQQQALINKSNDDLRRKRPETTRPNHILLFTIINPFYPITVVSTLQEFIYIFYTLLRIFFVSYLFVFFVTYFIVVFFIVVVVGSYGFWFTNRTIGRMFGVYNSIDKKI